MAASGNNCTVRSFMAYGHGRSSHWALCRDRVSERVLLEGAFDLARPSLLPGRVQTSEKFELLREQDAPAVLARHPVFHLEIACQGERDALQQPIQKLVGIVRRA